MNDIIKEIETDIAEERYHKIFLVHGKKLIAAAVAAIVLTAVLTVYNNYMKKKSRASGTIFVEAFDDNDIAKYDQVIAKGQKGYAPMAALIKAGVEKKSDPKAAIKTLDAMINSSYDRAFREKARLDKIAIMIDQKADKKEIMPMFDEVTTEHSIFRPTALELKASYLLQQGDKKQALEIFEALAKDLRITSSAQERAKHILSTIQ